MTDLRRPGNLRVFFAPPDAFNMHKAYMSTIANSTKPITNKAIELFVYMCKHTARILFC